MLSKGNVFYLYTFRSLSFCNMFGPDCMNLGPVAFQQLGGVTGPVAGRCLIMHACNSSVPYTSSMPKAVTPCPTLESKLAVETSDSMPTDLHSCFECGICYTAQILCQAVDACIRQAVATSYVQVRPVHAD